MKLTMYQVDAFADRVFEGNPAAVCPLETWPDDELLQSIATENNLSETAFFAPEEDAFRLRWFTPVREVDLCGHATLASAHVLFQHLGHSSPQVRFLSRSGPLIVERATRGYRMDFPCTPPKPTRAPDALIEGMRHGPAEILVAPDYVAVYESEEAIRELDPDFGRLAELDTRGVLATAPGEKYDFVSRCFFPRYGIDEDPVTGSAHCAMAPYWSARLGKNELVARQISKRGGTVHCEVKGDRVLLTGNAVDFMKAEITIG